MKIRHELKVFASIMEHKLEQNDHKGNFVDQDPKKLLMLLKEEVDELEESIKEDDYFHTLTEAADVANFALIIAWNVWLAASKGGENASQS